MKQATQRVRNQDAKALYQHYLASKKYRAEVWDPRVKQIADYLWGDQGIRRTSRPEQNDFVTNILYKDFTISVSMMCRGNPSCTLTPIISGMEDKTEELMKVINHDMMANEIPVIQTQHVSHGLPFGSSHIRWSYDTRMRMGLGGIRLGHVDPRNVFYVPGIARVSESLLFFERQRIDKLRAYHDHPNDIPAIDALFKKSDPMDDMEAAYDDGEAIPVQSDEFGADYATRSMRIANDKPYIERVIAWMIDPRTVADMPRLLDDYAKSGKLAGLSTDQEERLLRKPLFPRGRMVVFAEGHQFESKPNPFPSFPYAQYVNQFVPTARPGDEFGMGEYDQLLEMQDKYNVRDNQVTDAMDKVAFGGRILSDGTFDAEEVNNSPASVTQVQRLGNVGVIPDPHIPPEAFRYLDNTFIMGRELQNRSSVSQGENPSGVRSGDQVQTLHDLSNQVMISRTHALEASYRAMIRGQISMIGMYYKPGVHYTDKVDLRGIHPDAFEIRVDAGLNLPASEQQKLLWARQLFEMQGALDREEILRLTPGSYLGNDKQAVIERMREKWKLQQQAAQEQHDAEVDQQRAKAESDRARVPNLQVVQ